MRLTGGELLRLHEVVFLGVGLGPDSSLSVPGAQGPGVIGALEWIRRVKLDPDDHAAVEELVGLERRHRLPDLARDVERGLGPVRRHAQAAAARP